MAQSKKRHRTAENIRQEMAKARSEQDKDRLRKELRDRIAESDRRVRKQKARRPAPVDDSALSSAPPGSPPSATPGGNGAPTSGRGAPSVAKTVDSWDSDTRREFGLDAGPAPSATSKVKPTASSCQRLYELLSDFVLFLAGYVLGRRYESVGEADSKRAAQTINTSLNEDFPNSGPYIKYGVLTADAVGPVVDRIRQGGKPRHEDRPGSADATGQAPQV